MTHVFFALDRESRPFRRRCPGVAVHVTGVGVEHATRAVDDVLSNHTPSRIIFAGFGGALTLSSQVGDVIAASEVRDEHGHRWPCGGDGGCILTVDRMIATVEEKLRLGESYRAVVCDMESAAVAERCHAYGIPFTAVRAISDCATHTLSPTLDRLIVNGQVSIPAVVWAVWKEPRLIGQFRMLARNTTFAAKRLAETLQKMITS